jgi:hypothetical protein
MTSGFAIDFSMVCSPNRVLTPLKSASFEIRLSSFVPPSKIFVWGGVKMCGGHSSRNRPSWKDFD